MRWGEGVPKRAAKWGSWEDGAACSREVQAVQSVGGAGGSAQSLVLG
jgi:hypothetical protein